jgi:ribose/xylose/arabinose/galactoside ABC-type transport system permease subunit
VAGDELGQVKEGEHPSSDAPKPDSGANTLVLGDAGQTAVLGIRISSRRGQLLYRYAMVVSFLVLLGVMLVVSPTFRNPANLTNILQQNAIIGIVACGMLVMIIAGGFDLSVGAIGALSAMVGAAAFATLSIPLGVVVALGAAVAFGLFNGVLIGKIGINPFVATLGTQVIIRGILLISTNGQPVYGTPQEFIWVGLGKVGPVPVSVIIYALVIVMTGLLLRFTRMGQYIYAVGGNAEAARLAGINVDRVLISAFVFGGLCAGIAGIVMLGTTLIGHPTAAETWPLTAIAAVVVGGVPLSGGSGGVGAAVLGTLLLGVVANSLNLLGVSQFWQPVVMGAVIILAVGLEAYQRKRRANE